jgi:heat shock protein HtpX
MYIVNPLEKGGMQVWSLFSTHPPIGERIKILRGMMHGVSYLDYQKAFSSVKGHTASIIPPSALRDSKAIPVREASVKEEREKTVKEQARAVGDLMRVVNNYAFLVCMCGLKIKVPPNFKKSKIPCPRCRHQLDVPFADVKTAAVVLGAAMAGKSKVKKEARPGEELEPLVYARKGKGWESFSCSCGRLLQISPLFMGTQISCPRCGRKTEIKS